MAAKTMSQSLSVTAIPRLLGLESFKSDNLWTPRGNRGVFGGQVIGQALMAAIKTVEGKDLHSQHCYFLLPCNSQIPLTFVVERLRDGNSYSTRLVHAIQNSQTIFILMASFVKPTAKEHIAPLLAKAPRPSSSAGGESGDEQLLVGVNRFDVQFQSLKELGMDASPFIPRYQRNKPEDIGTWDDANTPEKRFDDYIDTSGDFGIHIKRTEEARRTFLEGRDRTMPLKTVRARPQSGKNFAQRAIWLQPRLDGDKLTPNEVRAMIGYFTDSQTVAAAGRTVGLSATSDPKMGMLATIDHTIHFYPFPDDYDYSRPILHVLDAVVVDVPAGRGLVAGRVYTESGVLIAATSQEGVVRASLGQGTKPRSEGARL